MVNIVHIKCLRVLLKRSATWAFVSLYVTKKCTFSSLRNVWKALFLNSVPASVCNFSGLRPRRNISLNAATSSLPVLVLRGTTHANLESTSIQVNKYSASPLNQLATENLSQKQLLCCDESVFLQVCVVCNRVVIATIQILESELLHIDGLLDIVCPHHPKLKDGLVHSTVSLKVGSSGCCSSS